jgi:hypothetical protein
MYTTAEADRRQEFSRFDDVNKTDVMNLLKLDKAGSNSCGYGFEIAHDYVGNG